MTMVRNRPTPVGRMLGVELARLADKAEIDALKLFPNQKHRCRTCAFRKGTVPNGCESTLMDAIKCVMERVPFMCHESKDNADLCMGWLNSQDMAKDRPLPTPWEFSK